MEPKFPNIEVELVGTDGNAFSIIGKVSAALRRSGEATEAEVEEFVDEATSGDYDNLLRTCLLWVNA
jgi:hypothetical protein